MNPARLAPPSTRKCLAQRSGRERGADLGGHACPKRAACAANDCGQTTSLHFELQPAPPVTVPSLEGCEEPKEPS
jgi:hypothetical protein